MNRMQWMILLRLSPYIYFLVIISLLLIFAATHTYPGFITPALVAGLVWFLLSRLAAHILIRSAVREQVQRGALVTGQLGEIPDVERPVDADRVRAAVSRLDGIAGGCPGWLGSAVDEWLAASPGAGKNQMRDKLLQRLYAEAGLPGDQQQRRALNEVRLAINPWVGET